MGTNNQMETKNIAGQAGGRIKQAQQDKITWPEWKICGKKAEQ
jgi:hypothetical protein